MCGCVVSSVTRSLYQLQDSWNREIGMVEHPAEETAALVAAARAAFAGAQIREKFAWHLLKLTMPVHFSALPRRRRCSRCLAADLALPAVWSGTRA